ncbi:hypothetical protein RUND412_009364, partial [Rhizina undulata]
MPEPAIYKLPVEVFRELALSKPLDIGDLARLNRCSRRFREATSCLLFYRCTLDLRRSKIQTAFAALDALAVPGNPASSLVQELVFVGMTHRGYWDLARDDYMVSIVFEKIILALKNMDNLRKFQWKLIENLPDEHVIGQLAGMESLRSINIGFERDNEEKAFLPRTDWGLTQPYLTVPKGLYSLGVSFNSNLNESWSNKATMEHFRDMVCSSPHIQIMRSTPEILDTLFHDNDIVWNIGNNPPCVPKSLEISLFRHQHSMNYRLGKFFFDNPDNNIIDMTRLENLVVDDSFSESWAGFFPKGGPLKTIRSLDRVGYAWDSQSSEISSFLESRSELEEITFLRSGRDAPDGWSKGLLNCAPRLRTLCLYERLTPDEIEDWPAIFPKLEALTFRAPGLDTWEKPEREMAQLLPTFGKLRSLRVLRFANAYLSDTPGEEESLALQTIEAVNAAAGTEQWKHLRFVCTISKWRDGNYMTAWQRRKNGTWKDPVHVKENSLFVERVWLDNSLSLAMFDAWDEWL